MKKIRLSSIRDFVAGGIVAVYTAAIPSSAAAVTTAGNVMSLERDTVSVLDFGAWPDSHRDASAAFKRAAEECCRKPGSVLLIPPGRYDLWRENCAKGDYFVSNTTDENEWPDKTKYVGILLKNAKDVEVVGKGATLMMQGRMTPMVIDNCEFVVVSGLTLDFERPGGFEFTYEDVVDGYTTVRLHPDTHYDILPNGRIAFVAEGFSTVGFPMQCILYDPETKYYTYSGDWNVLRDCPVEELSHGLLRFRTPAGFNPRKGTSINLRDVIRDELGTFITDSREVSFKGVTMHYMHGMGFVGQYSRDLAFDSIRCEPSRGRLLAAANDFMQFSGCGGKVSVNGSRFVGAQDDGINIHGTNLRIVKRHSDKKARLRFMHHQSYGFNAFRKGDSVAIVEPQSMLRMDTAKVVSVKRIDDREMELVFDRPLPRNVVEEELCVENITWTPEVSITGNYFSRIDTRGILVTTPRKVVIQDNIFDKLGMSAILIEGDSRYWFESGPCQDVSILDNTFIECGYNNTSDNPSGAVIGINPSNSKIDPAFPVHRNIRIIGNTFRMIERPVMRAKSAGPIVFRGNIVTGIGRPEIFLNGCSSVDISDNNMPEPVITEM